MACSRDSGGFNGSATGCASLHSASRCRTGFRLGYCPITGRMPYGGDSVSFQNFITGRTLPRPCPCYRTGCRLGNFPTAGVMRVERVVEFRNLPLFDIPANRARALFFAGRVVSRGSSCYPYAPCMSCSWDCNGFQNLIADRTLSCANSCCRTGCRLGSLPTAGVMRVEWGVEFGNRSFFDCPANRARALFFARRVISRRFRCCPSAPGVLSCGI